MADEIKGTIASVKFLSETPTKWKKWDVTLNTGAVYTRVSVPPDGPSLNVGDAITLVTGKYTKDNMNWQWQKNDDSAGTPAASTPSAPASSGRSGINWADQNEYSQKIRDPKIERQTWARIAVDVYIAALPYMAEPPSNTQELDMYIDDAIAKGEALYETKSKL